MRKSLTHMATKAISEGKMKELKRIGYFIVLILVLLFALPTVSESQVTYSNTNSITIPDISSATPYPSTITVPSLSGTVTKVTVTITGLTHTYPDDVRILLVGPQGQDVLLMYNQGAGLDVSGVNLTFDDSAASQLPDTQITSGTYRPCSDPQNDDMTPPAPTRPYGTTMSVFNGVNPQGTWSLYVLDYAANDAGSISGGWQLTLTGVTAGATAYSYRKAITIGGQMGASCSADLTNFPVLISLSGVTEIRTTSNGGHVQNSNGYDIIFKDASGVQLDHEVESYNGTTGTLVAWVRIPTLDYNGDTLIFMYYGNSSISTSQENVTGVWNSNYKGVWHLHNGIYLDSTSNNNDGTNTNTTNNASAKIAGARTFDGTNANVSLGSGTTVDDIFNGGGTISAWIYPTGWGTGTYGRILDKADNNGTNYGWAWQLANTAGNGNTQSLHINRDFTSTWGRWNTPTNSISLSAWQHVVLVYDDSSTANNPVMYINGVSQTITEQTNPSGGSWRTDGAQTLLIGDTSGAIRRTFDGTIDEARLYKGILTACWIDTEYNNQNTPGTFYEVGSEEPLGFNYYKPLTIQSSMMGTSCGTSGVTEFPLLISLSGVTEIKTVANGGHVQSSSGYDIIFKDGSGVKLDHEIESYDGLAGNLVAWVRVPVVSGTTNTALSMYYGNSNVTSSTENKTGVWDSNYKAVWHLKETSGNFSDSTGRGNDGTDYVSATGKTGKIGSGQEFDGSGDYLDIGDKTDFDFGTSDFSASFWIYKTSGTTLDYIMGKRPVCDNTVSFWNISHDTGIIFEASEDGSVDYGGVRGSYLSDNNWHYVQVQRFSNTIRFWINGTSADYALTNQNLANSAGFRIGGGNPCGQDYNGYLDEVRILSTVRDACWIQTEYNNQNSPSTFYSVGGEQGTKKMVMVTADGTFNNGDDNAKKAFFEGLGYVVTAIADTADQATYDSAAAGNDIMWISATVNDPTTAGTRARTLDIGIISDDNSTWDELMYYSGSSSAGSTATTINITTNSHYITEPFSTGNLTVFSSSTTRQGWNIALPAGATLLAEVSSGGADTVFVFDDGGELYNTNYAANRRVLFGVTDNTGFSNRTANLETLIERALDWAGGTATGEDVTLANHTAGQETDKFTSGSSVTGAELFAFKLTNNIASGVTVDQVQFQLSGVSGVVQTDFANLAIYVDANNDGTIDGGETTAVGGTGVVNAGVTTITFTNDFTISASATVNYILKGDVSNLVAGDTVTMALGTSNITLVSGTVGGSAATNVTHTADAAGGLTQIHYRWRNDDGSEGLFGTGADGALAPAGPFNLNTNTSGARSYADGIAYRIDASTMTGNSVSRYSGSVTLSNGIAAGDEVILINLQGASGDTADVGNYEFLRVQSVTASTVTFTTNITKSYDGTTPANQKVIIQRVPNYSSVTLDSTDTLAASAWDGLATTPTGAAGYYSGLIAFRATGTVSVGATASISVNALGYRAGNGVTGTTSPGYQGESDPGSGVTNYVNNAGAGGGGAVSTGVPDTCGEGGGGGGYGSVGTAGGYGSWCGGTLPMSNGGATYGIADLSKIYLGSGGGGGAVDNDNLGASGNGARGAGLVIIIADSITVNGGLRANGGDGSESTGFGDTGNGGGGSGGSIYLAANSVTLAGASTTATGGAGYPNTGDPNWDGTGGDGGVGRIRIEADSITGTTSPSASTAGTPGGTGASWAEDQDTTLDEAIPGKVYRLRFEVSNEGTVGSGAVTYKLQVAQTDTCGSGTYTDVPTDTSGHFQIINSTYLTDGGATTDVVSGLTNEATTFVAGQVKDTGNTTGSITLNTNQFTELEFAVQATDNSLLGANYCFRLVAASGTSISTYSVYGEIGTSACQYLYRKPLIIDYTKRGSICGTSGLTEFPVLISMSGVTDIKTTANGGHVQSSNGYDIIFRASNGIDELWHEIESYDGSTGTLVAWVRVPTVSGTANTTIYMYYGNACILSATQSPIDVWDTNYKAVWHLAESGNGTAGEFKDSTSNANHGRGGSGTSNMVPTRTTPANGRIGYSQDFDGGDHIRVPDNASLQPTSITVEGWIKLRTAASSYETIVGRQTGTGGGDAYNFLRSWDGKFGLSTQAALNVDDLVLTYSPETWYHLVATQSSSEGKLYINGSLAFTGAAGALSGYDANDVTIGGQENGSGSTIDENINAIFDEARISSIVRDACWIQTEYNNQNWPNKTDYPTDGFVTIGAEQGAAAPTAVNLISFKATGDGGSVVVSWTTAQEINNFGFHVYRSESVGGPYTRITDRLIPGLTFSVRGRDYSYVDRNVARGRLYYYKLEDIDMDGTRRMHGPVCVDWDGDGIPDDWEIKYGLNPAVDDSGLDPDGDGLTNLQEYYRNTDPVRLDTDGDGVRDSQEYFGSVTPGLMRGVEVIASDATGITLELRTESFESVVLDVGGVSYRRLRVPEYVHGYTEVVGKPELPVKGILLDLPVGYGGTLSVESVESKELSNYWIYPVPEKVVSGEGELATVSEVFFIDDAAYRVNSFYPDVVAKVGETYDYRGQKKLQVFFNPFSFNPVTREMVQYTRIRVRVAYVALAEEEPVVRPGVPLSAPVSSLARSVAWVPPDPASAYKMVVSEEGIYRVTSAWLTSQGVGVSDWGQVRVYYLGQEIPIYQGADYIEFYGVPPAEGYSKYTRNNVYWLTTSGGSGSPLRMGTIDGTPGAGTIPSTHVFTVRMEEDREYLGEAPGAESLDRWVHGTFALGTGAGGGPTDYPVTLPGVGGTQLGQVTLLLCGLTTLDHDVEIAFNGVSLGTYQWSGFEFYEVSFGDVPLVDGANTLTLTCLSGTDPVNPDGVALDWVEVAYPRTYQASGNLLKLTHNAGYRYQIGSFTSNSLQAYDITTPADVKRLTGATVSPTNPYTLTMEPRSGAGERSYITLSSTAVKTPVSITKDTAGNLSGTSNGADYVLITHRDLGWDGGGTAHTWMTNLKSHREAQGLRVKAVDIADIYDEFSYGIASPQGIKDFLSYTYQNWVSPAPQYVLLVGDSAYDPKDNYGLGTINYVPTYLARTPFMGESLTDEWFVRISGNDAIADMDIGRLPASTTAQAEMMVNKIITYENTPILKTWERNTLLVADNQVEGYEILFELMNEDAAGILPTGMNAPFREYLNNYVNPNDLTLSMRSRLNVDGALIWNYSGHGSVQVWASESIFSNGDVATLTNAGKLPFAVAMTCLNGFFGYPEGWSWPSLAEVLLRDSANGAVGAFMSTGMTEPEAQRVLDQALFEGIFRRDYRTLGRAISYAKQELVANSAALGETGKTFLLFGDPAMRLKVPLPTAPTAPTGQVSGNSVTLSWGASTDANGTPVAGYNVYRSTTPNGPYTKVNTTLITNTQYADSTVQSGTYYYVIRSVDSDGYESAATLEMSVTIGARSVGGSGGGGGGGCFISAIAN